MNAEDVIVDVISQWVGTPNHRRKAQLLVNALREAVADLDGDGVVIDDDGNLGRLRCVSVLGREYVPVWD